MMSSGLAPAISFSGSHLEDTVRQTRDVDVATAYRQSTGAGGPDKTPAAVGASAMPDRS